MVGRALRHLPPGSDLPWHRVLNARGEISDRGAPEKERRQRRLLEREGVRFGPAGRVDLARHGWQPD
jgi:methylated-DNA-protein-cysteine methyltransferase-like protein